MHFCTLLEAHFKIEDRNTKPWTVHLFTNLAISVLNLTSSTFPSLFLAIYKNFSVKTIGFTEILFSARNLPLNEQISFVNDQGLFSYFETLYIKIRILYLKRAGAEKGVTEANEVGLLVILCISMFSLRYI